MTNELCSIEGCERPIFIKARGWCRPHYQRWHRTGNPLPPEKPTACSVNDGQCAPGSRLRQGFCDVHYARLRRHGDVTHREKQRDRGSADERWMQKVRVTPFGCWEWTAYVDDDGYGVHAIDGGKQVMAHRFVWELLVGPIPEGLDLDHLCLNRACCCPEHLEPVTHIENVHRSTAGDWQRNKTHCKNDHDFTPENTRMVNGARQCRECGRIRTRDYMRRKRAATKAAKEGEVTHGN